MNYPMKESTIFTEPDEPHRELTQNYSQKTRYKEEFSRESVKRELEYGFEKTK